MSSCAYLQSDGWKRFRQWVAQNRVAMGNDDEQMWIYYDFGPKDAVPLVCLPGVTGTAEAFYKVMLSLCPKGYRVISVQWPPYSTHKDWCKGLDKFLDAIRVDKIHLLGTSLGGYLAQCYIQHRPNRVLSLILCNSYCDLQYFIDTTKFPTFLSLMPGFVLKRMLLSNFPEGPVETEIANSIDFMVEHLETLSQADLASRIKLNCTAGPLRPEDLPLTSDKITLIDTMDEIAFPDRLREELLKYYPLAKRALLKSGGNFPFLSRSDEFNMHVEVHLRRQKYAVDTEHAAKYSNLLAAAGAAPAASSTDSSAATSAAST